MFVAYGELERKLKAKGVKFYPDPVDAETAQRRIELRKQIERSKARWCEEARKQLAIKREEELKAREAAQRQAKLERRAKMQEEARKLRRQRVEARRAALGTLPQWAKDVVRHVCQKHGVPLSLVLEKCRMKDVVLARNEVAYSLRATVSPITKELPSYPRIGQWLGGRDHSSIVHAVSCHARDTGSPALTPHKAETKRERSMEYQRQRKQSGGG